MKYIANLILDILLLIVGMVVASQGFDIESAWRILLGAAVMVTALYMLVTTIDNNYKVDGNP